MVMTAPAPPGPYARPVLGLLPEFRRDPTGFLQRMATQYGELVHIRLGPQNIYLLNHPDFIKDLLVTHNDRFVKSRILQRAKSLLGEGLLTSEGEFHLRQRRLSQPAFHRDRLIGYSSVMAQFAGALRDTLVPGAIDMDREMMRLTLGIVAKTLCNADVAADSGTIARALNDAVESFGFMMLPFAEYLERVPFLPFSRKLVNARRTLDSIIYRIIAERRSSGRDEGDLLSMLLMARDEADGSTMTDLQLRDELLTLFLAGHETTATALTWTWYLLSQHPEIEARMHAEIDAVPGGRLPGFDDYPNLGYTEMVLAESMRLFPPAWSVGRRSIAEHQVGGYTIAPGAIFVASQWVTHRNPKYWPDPERFDPERFRPEAREGRHKFAYFPFGGGPRVCIGERFAWLEGVLILATVARKWRFRLVPGHRVEPRPLITLRTRYGMRMVAERR
ncbi:MAG: cytochrome P450 [Bryobacterales bacterium]|nr:cytochrome P450 [Bryobacterales bacterium]